MSSGFEFLGSTAGFSIAWSVLPYEAGDSYLHVYLVGIVNTLAASLVAIVCTTLLGFVVGVADGPFRPVGGRYRHGGSEEHTSELQSLMRISYAVFCLKKKKKKLINTDNT